MCLLVSQPAGTIFTEDFLKGVYDYNPDGIGVMYAEDKTLFINRMVPTTEKEFIDFFRTNIEGKACAWHARMKTHGDIDLTNCHPYQVISSEEGYPLYMAHNGVLSFGNAADKSKSDTWHYIQDYLRPLLLKNPELFMEPAFQSMISSHIGANNKFILMDAYGNQVVINKQQGVEHNGAWLSNTYAWDTTGTKHDFKSRYVYSPRYWEGSRQGSGFLYGGCDEDEYLSVNPKKTSSEEDEALVFAVDFFAVCQDMNIDTETISWDQAEQYYKKMGATIAYSVIEGIEYGCYTADELCAEIHGMLDTNEDDEGGDFIFTPEESSLHETL